MAGAAAAASGASASSSSGGAGRESSKAELAVPLAECSGARRKAGLGQAITEATPRSTRSTGDESQPSRRKFPKHLVEIYDVESMLGAGAFSTVWRCRHRNTGQVRAVKKIDASELSPRDIAHEIALMKLLRHPNVVRCYDVFLEAQYVNIVVDMFLGGDLIDGLNTHRRYRGRIPNGQLAHLARQMVSSIVHVHSLCIVHRDIKGENFVSDRQDIGDPECVVALADFGTAVRLEPGAVLTEKVGTPAFWPPEVWKGSGYDFLVDVWATGVTIFVLLNGQLPFNPPTEENICRPVDDGAKPFVVTSFAPQLCIDFVAACLSKDPSRRPSALEAARHPWMETLPAPPPSAARQAVRRAGFALTSCLEGLGGLVVGICGCVGGFCLDLLETGEEKKNPSTAPPS